MVDPILEPWIPPERPDLATLAMVAADEAGVETLRSWPQVRKGGIAFGDLPPFLCWRGWDAGRWHLVLLQPREIGALVPGARKATLPEGWLEALEFEALARPLARHPDVQGDASVHVVQVPEPGRFRVRTLGRAAPGLIADVLSRISPIQTWRMTE